MHKRLCNYCALEIPMQLMLHSLLCIFANRYTKKKKNAIHVHVHTLSISQRIRTYRFHTTTTNWHNTHAQNFVYHLFIRH